jgi:hypothetical protein
VWERSTAVWEAGLIFSLTTIAGRAIPARSHRDYLSFESHGRPFLVYPWIVPTFVGTAGWNIPRIHRDRFAADGSQLQRYASRLNAAEINTSFYRPHEAAVYRRWAGSVPASFRFAVKVPKLITHERALTRARER